MTMPHKVQILITICFLVTWTQAYPSGAPSMSCNNLDPVGHGPSTNNGPAPYDVTFSATEYTPGKPLEVNLSGKNGELFKGFLIEAFPADGTSTEAVGTFGIPDGADYQSVCDTKTGNGVTHTNKDDKSNVSLTWTPSADTKGDLIFHYTVVRGKSGAADYFKDLKSNVLRAPAATSFQKDVDCGSTKGCYGNCNADKTCDWLVTWKQEGNSTVRLTLTSIFTSDNIYVAFGLSEQPKMSKSSVVSCRVHNENVDVIASNNLGYSNKVLDKPTEGLSDIRGTYTNGVLTCSLLRVMTSDNPDIFNLTDPWHLITARGKLNQDGSLSYHGNNDRFFTAQKVKIPNSVDISFGGGGDVTTTTPKATPNHSAPTTQPTTSPKGHGFPKDTECGKTKGCYSNCRADGACDWLITWSKYDDETVAIDLMSAFSGDNKYVAMGFSQNQKMFQASVVSCLLGKGKVGAAASFNPGYYNAPLQNSAVNMSKGSFQSGVLGCTVLMKTTSDDPKIFNLTQPWYLITARGDLNNGVLAQHDSNSRHVTVDKIDVIHSVSDLSFDSKPLSTLPTTPGAPGKRFKKDPDCGKTKACYHNCADDSCDFLLSWKKDGDRFEISLKSGFDTTDNHYVALGFAKEKRKMNPASVVQCVGSGGMVKSSLSYNSGYSNRLLASNDQTIVKQISNSFKDGVLSCTLSRPSESNISQIYDMSKKWYLIAARGDATGGIIEQHDGNNRFSTSSQVDWNDMTVDISMKGSDYPLIKAHGCLMVLAWILSASIGVAMARFFKPVWPDTTICGVKVWFAIHRSAMVLTFCLGLSALVIIFVQVDGYSEIMGEDYKKAHPILGIIVTALLFINPFMSLLRCGPDHPMRPLFNWAHFLVGSSAHILSAVTIALGLYLPKAQTDGETGLIIIIIYGSWQVLFFCIMSALDCIAKNDSKIPALQHLQMKSKSKQSFTLDNDYSNMSNINPGSPDFSQSFQYENKNEVKMSSAKQWVMAFHVVVITVVAVYLMYMIIDA